MKKQTLYFSTLYIYISIFFGPLTLMLGLGSTSGGGDETDSSYLLADGALDIQKRNAEFLRARNIVYVLAGLGVLAGLSALVSTILSYKRSVIGIHSLAIRSILTVFMISGYVMALYLAFVWFDTI